MSKLIKDPLFQLVQSLSKAEKRHFRLFVGNTKYVENAKFILLFDYLVKQSVFDEAKLLRKLPEINPRQLSNLKAHLYNYILSSLRQLHSNDIDLRISVLINNATILYNKCLYDSSRKQLERARSLALKNKRNSLLLEVSDLDKKLIIKLIKSNIEKQVDVAVNESKTVIRQLNNINLFKDLSLKLYAHYLKIGFIRNDQDLNEINSVIETNLPEYVEDELSFEEKQHLFQLMTGYYFFIQAFKKAHVFAQKWVHIYLEEPHQQIAKTENYLKSINNLMVAESKLLKLKEFDATLDLFDKLLENKNILFTENVQLLLFKYRATGIINKYFMIGDFTGGVEEIPKIAIELENQDQYLDQHWRLIFYYKFACMYFGNEQYEEATYWLNEILNTKDVDLRSDILVFSRVLNLICHWELGNTDLMEYYVRSTYRFFHKKADFHLYQQAIIKFIRRLPLITKHQLRNEFLLLKEALLPLTKNIYEKRAFIYFDILSWLEAKISGRLIQSVIQEKAARKLEN